MGKKKNPNFVTEAPNTFALNRAARRLARRKGWNVTYVPMPQLRVLKEFARSIYWMEHITGELVDYIPYGPNRTEDAAR